MAAKADPATKMASEWGKILYHTEYVLKNPRKSVRFCY
jgi:hypothetical protein